MVGIGPKARPGSARTPKSPKHGSVEHNVINSPRHQNGKEESALNNNETTTATDSPERSKYNLSPRGRSASWTLTFDSAKTQPPEYLPSEELIASSRGPKSAPSCSREIKRGHEWDGGVEATDFDRSRGDTPSEEEEIDEEFRERANLVGNQTPRSPIGDDSAQPIPISSIPVTEERQPSAASRNRLPSSSITKSQILLESVRNQSFGNEYSSLASTSVEERTPHSQGARQYEPEPTLIQINESTTKVKKDRPRRTGDGRSTVGEKPSGSAKRNNSTSNKASPRRGSQAAEKQPHGTAAVSELSEVWNHLVAARNERERTLLQEREQEVELVEALAIEKSKRLEFEAQQREEHIQRERFGQTSPTSVERGPRTFIRIVPNPRNPLHRHENSLARLQSCSPSRSASSRVRRRQEDSTFDPNASGFDDSEVVGAEALDDSNSRSPRATSPLRPQRHISWVEQFSNSKLKSQRRKMATRQEVLSSVPPMAWEDSDSDL